MSLDIYRVLGMRHLVERVISPQELFSANSALIRYITKVLRRPICGIIT